MDWAISSRMERGSKRESAASFLCSPIPRDPAQVFYLDAHTRSGLRQKDASSVDSFLTTEVEMSRLNVDAEDGPATVRQLQERILQLESDLTKMSESKESESDRSTKRQRLAIESIAVSKSEQLTTEMETLQVQMQSNSERHQIEIKKRDMQLDQLRRQLQYAVAEEEDTRKELKTLTNEYSSEKLTLQKKIVELDSKLAFVEANLNEWKEKALDSTSQLRTVTRQSNLKIQLLQDQLDATVAQYKAARANQEDPLLGSKVKLLEAQLAQKNLEVERSASSLLSAQETVENSRDIRELKERILELESNERKLKTELVDLIGSSKSTSVLEERLYQLQQKLKNSDERYAHAQARIENSMAIEESYKELEKYFEQIVADPTSGASLDQLKTRPALTIIELYRARQNAFEILFEQKGNADIQLRRLEQQYGKLQSDIISAGNRSAKLEVQLAEHQQKMLDANNVVAHLRKVNEELLEILGTYEKDPDDKEANELSSRRMLLLESSLKEAEQLIKGMEITHKEMVTPAVLKKHQGRIERLEKELAEAKHQNSNLTKHLEKVEMELAIYEKRVGKGEFNVETTKIVHLAVNPTRELLESKRYVGEVERLKQENAALQAKLEQLTGGSLEVSPISSESQMKTTTSYDTVEGQKLLNQRLKEVFQGQTQKYREAVYLLTGYKVDMKMSNGTEILRLRSVYADHEDDDLLVRMDSNGALELLDTDYCAQIDQRVFAYLTTCRSFPAFLSTLTLHLFEKQTFQGN